jgi:hypothetical protein
MAKHNHLAVWIMVIVQMLLGYVWYSVVFAEAWLAAQSRSMEQMQSAGVAPFFYAVAGAVFMAYTISWIVQATRCSQLKSAIPLALLLCTGFAFPSIAVHYKFLGVANTVMLIDLFTTSVNIILTTCVLAGWKDR